MPSSDSFANAPKLQKPNQPAAVSCDSGSTAGSRPAFFPTPDSTETHLFAHFLQTARRLVHEPRQLIHRLALLLRLPDRLLLALRQLRQRCLQAQHI